MGSEHNGHRARMRERAKKTELSDFTPHEILELILFGSRARGNVNPLAHALIERFGSASAALSAGKEALLRVNGVGTRTAEYLSSVNALLTAYQRESPARLPLSNPATAKAYIHGCLADISAPGIWQFNLDTAYSLLRAEQIASDAELAGLVCLGRRCLASAVSCSAGSILLVYHLPARPPALSILKQARDLADQLALAKVQLLDMLIHDGARLYSARDHMLLCDPDHENGSVAMREDPKTSEYKTPPGTL